MLSSKIGKLIEHAQRFGFIAESASFRVGQKGSADCLASCQSSEAIKDAPAQDYGPFGSQMRKNIVDLWWKHSVTLQDRIFPLCVTDDKMTTLTSQSAIYRTRAELSYQSFAKNLSCDELGIAQIFAMIPGQGYLPNSSPLVRSQQCEYLTVHHFCHTKRGSTLFNDVIKKRLRWWKRFSNKQANFSHHVKEDTSNGKLAVAEILHDCSIGKQVVESISFGQMQPSSNHKNIIECCTNVEQVMFACLDDGFEERVLGDGDKNQGALRLHHSIAPVKLMILIKDSSDEEQIDLASRLNKEVKTAGIMCHKLSPNIENEAYRFADAIGTPFCLRIDEMTLKRGIVGLRHRDTTVHEYMHISEVVETLTKIMKLS